ncbi:IS1634 family transposase [Clostridium sp. JN-9]|jgi:transposase|uniref:IS1634 family transposase n=1 Tax=Clostridium sp. JN-9 TaxID=2507159 RepID=UPI000FFE27B9|nr:IS1634 family transposase [Clostridium sp. JN-9]QAT39609.1 IS1634 family transposase [Clostridium sp. JN-9]QAT39882.1 IS1634 family transposase [Clostridium sp. JN-9]QAT39983.1 IS1634 family transposase [Clostridium sp. JN-9]QAT40786.1 IS1634 family transposase [Clostridium sp. JN-9]
MKLNYDKKSKDPTYFIQMGIRNGKKTTTKNVKRIGKYSELLAITTDPLEYAKKQVEEFNKEYKEGKIDINLKVDFSEKLSPTKNIASKSALLNVGYFILQHIYHDLKLSDFFHDINSNSKITFDCNTINRFLTFARILEPTSKLGTFDKLDSYYEKPYFEYQHILRFMDLLEDNYDEYLEHLFINSNNIIKRNTSICYFDCTNYYFESEDEDDEYVDEATGEILKGLRRYGLSKEHRPNPIVQMGLFMDGDGIPISMCINSGSDNEQKCAVPLEQKITKMFKNKQFIYCADAGLGSFNIRKFNSMGGRAFIVTQSVKKLSDKLKEAVFNDFDYRRISDDSPITISFMKGFDRFDKKNLPIYNDTVYKIIDADSAMDVGLYEKRTYKNGKSRIVKSKAFLKQKIIITFSRKMMEYQRHIRNAQIERAKNLLNNQNIDNIKKGPHDVTRFIKRTSKGNNGEKASDHYEIDQSIIDREEKYDGYYAVATNLDDDAKSILTINSNRYKIEDCFRILKSNFNARPVYHRNRNRIIAHFMICYTSLLIYRLLENKLDLQGTHFTADDILETLRNMNVMNTQDAFYTATYTGSQVCTALNGLFNLGLDKKYYLPKELNKKIKKFLS